MKHWYGVRRLYEPRFQARVVLVLLTIAVLYYAVFAITNWLSLDAAALRFDFVNYFGGAQAAAHGTDIYADFKRSWGSEAWVVAYIYPPLFALVLAPLTSLGLLAAGRIWLVAVHLAFVGALALILRVHPELSRTGRRLFLLASFAFMPVYLNVKFQQVATVWLLLLSAALWAALRRRDSWAGAFIAIAASLKVVPIFLLPLFLRLGRRRVAAMGAVLLLAVTGVTMVAAPGSWQFFTVVLPRIGLGTANWDNGSIDGLVSRIVAFAPNLFGPATTTVAKLVIAAGVAIIVGVTLWQARDGRDHAWSVRLGLAALITALLIVSSVTWQHHLVTLLLPIATAMAWIAVRRPPALFAWWLGGAYLLCWTDRRIVPLPADQLVHSLPQALLVLAGTSIKLVGLVLLWALLLRMLRWERALAVRQPATSPRADASAA